MQIRACDGHVGCFVAVAFSVVFALSAPAAAQRVVAGYSPSGPFTPPFIHSWNLATGQLEWSEPGLLGDRLLFTADGRYLLERPSDATAPTVRVWDVMTRARVDVPMEFTPLVAHPRRTEVFGLAAGTAARLTPSGLTLAGGCPPGTTRDLDMVADGSTLVLLCDSGLVVLLDSTSGAVIRAVTVGAAMEVFGLVANSDGSRVVVGRGGATLAAGLALVDTTTGATLRTTTFPDPSPFPGVTCDTPGLLGASADRRTAVAYCSWSRWMPGLLSSFAITRLLDVDTLTWGLDLHVNYVPRAMTISPDARTVFVHSMGVSWSSIQVIDTATGATTAAVWGMTSGVAAAFPPLAPVLAATLSGARVDLQWTLLTHSPPASDYVLEVGSAPGSADLGTITLGASATLAVPAVPPGRYYVRVRGNNAAGAGVASNEVLVTVP